MQMNNLSMRSLLAAANFEWLTLIMAIGLVIAVAIVLFFKKDKSSWHKQAPSLITTLGIFCTFLGITIGLLRFDPNDEKSLVYLLSGLKLAFIPSALAVLLAIIFKWIYSKYYVVDHGAKFLDKLEQNTQAVERLAKAIEATDWQISHRENLEQNVEHSTRLLTVLESSLTNLINVMANKKENVTELGDDLESIISNCKVTLQKVNTDLSLTTEKLNTRVKSLFEHIQQQDKTVAALAETYNKFDKFNQSMEQLGDFASNTTSQLKQIIHNEVKEMEILISKSLKKAVTTIQEAS